LDLSAEIPSHDRFHAIFAALKPAELEKRLLRWVTALHELTGGKLMALERMAFALLTKSPLSVAPPALIRRFVSPSPHALRLRDECKLVSRVRSAKANRSRWKKPCAGVLTKPVASRLFIS